MIDRGAGMDDWVVPAVLVGLSLGLLLAVGIALAASAGDQPEIPTLAEDLEAYTACLVDQGAGVPRIEAGSDGGFAVIVPGSVLEGEFDESEWSEAVDACAHVAPDIFDLLFDGRTLDVFDGFDGHDGLIEGERRRGPGAGPWMLPPDASRRLCNQLGAEGFGLAGLRGDRLRRLCAELDR